MRLLSGKNSPVPEFENRMQRLLAYKYLQGPREAILSGVLSVFMTATR